VRPSFPFSTEKWASDAHLYSVYLSTNLMFYLLYWKNKFRIGQFRNLLIILLTIGATLLTGSRGGIVILVVGVILNQLWNIKHLLYVKSNVFFLFPVALLIIVVFAISVEIGPFIEGLLHRSFNFELIGDDSSIARIEKLKASFEQTASTAYLFGVGIIGSRIIWYDGILASLNAFIGLGGIFVVIAISFLTIRNHYISAQRNNQLDLFRVFLIIFLVYFIANLITEFLLVTRSVLPVAIFLSVISYKINRSVVSK